jgi:hypothetical protein
MSLARPFLNALVVMTMLVVVVVVNVVMVALVGLAAVAAVGMGCEGGATLRWRAATLTLLCRNNNNHTPGQRTNCKFTETSQAK